MILIKKASKNIVRQGENAGNQHFLLFPQCLLPIPKRTSVVKFILSYANALSLTSLKICRLVKIQIIIGQFQVQMTDIKGF